MTVEIIKVMEPISNSVVLLVSIPSPSNSCGGSTWKPRTAILKAFDRRFSVWLRDAYKAPSWTPSREESFRNQQTSGQPPEPPELDRLSEYSWLDIEEYTDAETESFFYHVSQYQHQRELSTYRALEHLQGTQVPTLYADAEIMSKETGSNMFNVKALLVEFIDGFLLEDLVSCVPQRAWTSICEQAISTVNAISDCGILNTDVRPTNVLVRRKRSIGPTHEDPSPEANSADGGQRGGQDVAAGGNDDGFEVVFIDFASCELRDPDESDEEWKRKKRTQDEEGAIGYIMEAKIEKTPVVVTEPFKYTPSYRYMEEGA